MNTFLSGLFLLSSFTPIPVQAAEPIPIPTLQEQAQTIALEHGVSFDIMDKIITDESKWESNPPGYNDDGQSVGLVQIYLPSHPNITREQALDPTWALNWLADELKADRAYNWTICSCTAEVRRLGAHVPTKDELVSNTTYPRVGGVVIQKYGELRHLSFVTSVGEDGIHVKETNFKKCERGTRIIPFNDSHTIGYWKEDI